MKVLFVPFIVVDYVLANIFRGRTELKIIVEFYDTFVIPKLKRIVRGK